MAGGYSAEVNKSTKKFILTYLSDPLQDPDSNEEACPQVSSHRGEQRKNYGPQDPKAHQPLGPEAACQISSRDLCQDVAVEEGAQDPALGLGVPVVHAGLLREGLRNIPQLEFDQILGNTTE